MKALRKLLFPILTAVVFIHSSAQSNQMANYCATPPFLTGSIPPNILFVVDVSGSMGWAAYYKTWSETNSSSEIGEYNPNITYEGYFIPDKVYELSDNDIWIETSKSENCEINLSSSYYWFYGLYYNTYSISGICSGNKLNFALMDRIDLLRWAITGGRPEGCGDVDDKDCDPNIACTGDTCVLETNDGDKVEVPTWRINGILQVFEKENVKPRFGAIFFESSIRSDKVYIGDYLNGNSSDPDRPYTYLKRAINYIAPDGGTGTAPAMWEAYDYFKQQNDHDYSNGFQIDEETFKDPNYFCDADGKNCKPVPCAKNFVILASDGQWNRGGYPITGTCTIETDFENNSADPVVPAYKMHKEVLRKIISLSGIEYDINVSGVYSLGLFLGGTGEQSLKNVAVYGSFDTNLYDWPFGVQNGDHWNGDGAYYPWDTCTMDDCGDGRGSACSPLPPSSPDWDSNGDGEPDNFLSAKNATEIRDSLLKFIRNILKQTASGTSVSVLTEKDKKGAIVTQAVFYDQKYFGDRKVDWLGHLYTYWFLNTKLAQNIREDTERDNILNITEDRILNFYIDDKGKLQIDACESDANGNPTTSCITKTIDELAYLWDAGEVLKETDADDRNLYTPCYSGDECDLTRKLTAFSTENINLFETKLGTNIEEFPSCLGEDIETARQNIVKYIRGEDIDGCRSRETGSGVWKLADIIYSTPKIVEYKDYSVVFASSNDGVLHAFKIGKLENIAVGEDLVKLSGDNLGEELWGFIPSNALPYLRYLADPDYCHIYITDLSPYIVDTDYNNDGIKEVVLIGGMRLGGGCGCKPDNNDCINKIGENCCINPPEDVCEDPENDSCVGKSAYYALDITDPENPKLLWEFTHPKLGYSYSGPAYVRRLDDTGKAHHFVLFASGPTTHDGFSSQHLSIFVLDMATGELLLTANKDTYPSSLSSLWNTFGGRLYTNGLDVNEDGQTDYVFLGYVRITDPHTSDGGVVKIWTGSTDPSKWDFDTETLNFAQNPITAKIETGKCFNRWYLYIGTGRFFYKEDDMSNVNALYGVPFNCDANNNCDMGTINPVHIGFGENGQKTELDCTDIGSSSQGAWMIYLDDGNEAYYKERNIADPSFVNNIIFFATTQPTKDLCGFGGLSRAWAMNCATGDPISSTRCSGYTINNITVKYLLQLSGGDIQQFGKLDFTEEGGIATKKVFGITSEQGGTPVLPGGIKGEIILWLEK
ncbi:pilus assembly protein [Persephonella sp.]